jgi:hypothetical protein
MRRAILFLVPVLAAGFFLATWGAGQRVPGGSSDLAGAHSMQTMHADIELGKIQLQFIPNRGQVDGPAAFYVLGRDKAIYFASEGLTFVLGSALARGVGREGGQKEITASAPAGRWIVKLDFVGANEGVKPVGLEGTGATFSFFKGRPEEWTTGLAASSKIAYRDLWPGIDLVYYGTANRLKYEFVVRPGADPSRVRLAYRGAESVTLTPEGRLEVSTPLGGFQDDVPVAWQEIGGKKVPVDMAYTLTEEGDREHVYGLRIGEYDRTRALVIDPAVLVYCGYIGGVDQDYGTGVAVDSAGNAYVTGYTRSTETSFPNAVGPDLTQNGNADAFVAKISPDGATLIYCGFIGGSADDVGGSIAVDDSGNAVISGYTWSGESTFPVLVGPVLTHSGQTDAFVAKVGADGSALLFCGYIGGDLSEYGIGLALDASFNLYISGYTWSSEGTFPVTVGPDLTHNGDKDAFVAKVKADGTALDYCGYIGGAGNDQGERIAVDGSGNAYVTGYARSDETTFPVTVGPDLTFNGGWADAFVAKVKADGTALDYCGYIGGSGDDAGFGVAVDPSGCAYYSGYTTSTEATFPVVRGPDLTHNGVRDCYVAKASADGTELIYCGYIGGSAEDVSFGLAVDGTGMAYVTGHSSSSENTFPVAVGPDLTHNGGADVFVAKVTPSGTGLVSCGYIGGENNDYGVSIAVGDGGNAYIAGYTTSSEATFPVLSGPGLTYQGDWEGFVLKVSMPDVPAPLLSSLLPSSASAGDSPFVLSVIGSDFIDGAVVRWDGEDRPTTFLNSFQVDADIDAADIAAGWTVQVTVRNADDGLSDALEFTINNPVPALTSVNPVKATAGGSAFTLTLLGSNFVPNSVVRWGGSDKATTYVSGTELQAAIAAADIATAGEVHVTVFNPAPSGGTSSAVAFPVVTFTMGATPASATVAAGQSATYTVQATPQHGSFDSAIALSATGLPRGCTASFAPASVMPGAAPASSTLTLRTTARTGAAAGGLFAVLPAAPPSAGALLLLIPALGLLMHRVRTWGMMLRVARRWLAAAALVCLMVLISGCGADGGGGGGTPSTGTPAGTYTITVRGTSGSLAVSTQVTLVVN